ncbi:MAG TPA: hypothetical protein GX017_00375 [Clostridiales bacterium]|nr:hypothetical protein [Clostridiales bacterium]
MKKKVVGFCQHVFGISMTIAVLVGALVFVLLLIAFIAGGDFGQSLAIFCKNVMYKAITLSAIGSLVGMFAFYVDDSHELTLKTSESKQEKSASA